MNLSKRDNSNAASAEVTRAFTEAAARDDAEEMLRIFDDGQHALLLDAFHKATEQVNASFSENAAKAPTKMLIAATAQASFAIASAYSLSRIHRARRKQLEQRIEALEQRKGFEYLGVWDNGATYDKNDFVTHNGHLWACHTRTTAKPGTSEDWQLCVRAGRDARDR